MNILAWYLIGNARKYVHIPCGSEFICLNHWFATCLGNDDIWEPNRPLIIYSADLVVILPYRIQFLFVYRSSLQDHLDIMCTANRVFVINIKRFFRIFPIAMFCCLDPKLDLTSLMKEVTSSPVRVAMCDLWGPWTCELWIPISTTT